MQASQNSPFSAQFYIQRVEDCFNEVQEQIEVSSKSSYNKISQSIDQILLASIQPNVFNFQSQSTNSYSFIQSIFTNDYIHPIQTKYNISELKSTINTIVIRELKNKEKQLNQLFQSKLDKEIEEMKKEQPEYIGIIKQKDQGIEQINRKQILEKKYSKEVLHSSPFHFHLTDQNSIKQKEWCYAIAFNTDSSLVVAGCNKDIKVFQHQKGKLNQLQLLIEHTNNVLTLNFMKNKNNFVSGSQDYQIIIWQVIRHNQWNFQQKLNGHSNSIHCLLLNNTDDLIISGSADNTIKFWMKQDQWLYQQTITDHSHYVYSLSLNEKQNKLISCSKDQQILVIKQQKLNKQWSVTQKIQVDQFGLRLCFINNNQFTFQPYCKEQMHVYEMDSNRKQYRKTKEIAVKCGSNLDDCLFPLQFIKSKCLLMNKNGKNINLMRRKENGDFIIELFIEFSTDYNIFGQLSDDGEYLITWDDGSQEIQIRNCKQL